MRCKGYAGLACVDGSCPIALSDEYEERGMDVIKSCEDCWKYKGCEDCFLDCTEHCVGGDYGK